MKLTSHGFIQGALCVRSGAPIPARVSQELEPSLRGVSARHTIFPWKDRKNSLHIFQGKQCEHCWVQLAFYHSSSKNTDKPPLWILYIWTQTQDPRWFLRMCRNDVFFSTLSLFTYSHQPTEGTNHLGSHIWHWWPALSTTSWTRAGQLQGPRPLQDGGTPEAIASLLDRHHPYTHKGESPNFKNLRNKKGEARVSHMMKKPWTWEYYLCLSLQRNDTHWQLEKFTDP